MCLDAEALDGTRFAVLAVDVREVFLEGCAVDAGACHGLIGDSPDTRLEAVLLGLCHVRLDLVLQCVDLGGKFVLHGLQLCKLGEYGYDLIL